MKILVRYVLAEMIKIFTLVLTGLTLLIFIGLMGKEAVDKGLGLGPLLRMTPYLLPQALQFAVPGTMLLATTSVFGRMSSFNEIVAIKSLGISPMTIVWPALALAFLVSLAGVWLNDLAVSWGTLGVQRVFLESLEDVVYSQLRIQRTYTSDKLSIMVRGVEGRKLIQPTLIVDSTGSKPPLTVSAQEAELHANPQEGQLIVRFHNFEVSGPINVTNPDTYEHIISLDELTGVSSHVPSPSAIALHDIPAAVIEQRKQLDSIQQSSTASAAFAILTGDFDALSENSWQAHQRELVDAQHRLQRLYTEPWRRWANGFSCLCFVLIGAPMAIRLRHAEFLASFFACFLPILLVYYPLMAVSVGQAKDGSIPPPAVWLGNLVLAAWGAWLLRRVIRY
ncbi:MAG TPA: LptF/LptG family permease [Lacipirellulaceae bacterium]|jgi:lipopolysaccharide export system permease protein